MPDDVRTRLDEALRSAASRAYEAAAQHVGEEQEPQATRWRFAVSARVVITACCVLALALAVLWWAPHAQASAPPASLAGGLAQTSDPTARTPVPSLPPTPTAVVHVVGAVNAPGVYTLQAQSRVNDAVAAAGGASPDAALQALNLARLVVDGEQIVVPTVDQAAAAGPAAASEQQDHQALINLNTADAAHLEDLPGVGPVLAKRIVTYRDSHGPFATVDGVDAVPGVGPTLLAGIKDAATV